MKKVTIGLCFIATLFACIFLIGVIQFLFMGQSLILNKIFAPQQEQVRRETFEQSKAYRQGMVQELQNMQFQYVAADPAHKAALASIIKHRAADFPKNAMPSDLAQFIQSLN